MIYIILCLVAIVIIALTITVIMPFFANRRYIKMEMQRAASEDEYLFWKHKLKRMYVKSIPIIRHFIK